MISRVLKGEDPGGGRGLLQYRVWVKGERNRKDIKNISYPL